MQARRFMMGWGFAHETLVFKESEEENNGRIIFEGIRISGVDTSEPNPYISRAAEKKFLHLREKFVDYLPQIFEDRRECQDPGTCRSRETKWAV